MALQEILNKPLNKPLTAGAKYEAAIAEPIEKIGKTQQEIGEFEATKAEDLATREAGKTKAKAASTRAMREEIKTSPEMGMLKSTEEQLMNAAFVPTQDNAKDLAGLFSLINVIGFAIGRGGKGNAQSAMSAMNGMAEGYQKGRADLYKKEKDQFDTSMKALKTKSDILGRRLKEISELAAINKQAADEDADVLFAEQGADFLKKYKEKYGLAATVEFWKQVAQAKGKATELTIQEQKHKEDMAARERQHRETMAASARREAARMTHQEKMAELKSVGKPVSATNERYATTVFRASNEVLRSLELIEKIGITTGGGALGGVVGKGTIPSELQRNLGQYFTEEQQRNYNTAMSGIALELAYVLNGGYKPTEGQISKLDALLAVGPNDTYGNAAYKFSDVTAKLKAAIETSPAYTEDQRKTKDMLNQKMDRYATPEEVQARIYGTPKSEEPVVRAGEVSRPQTKQDFDAIPSGSLYIDPDDGKTYRKRK